MSGITYPGRLRQPPITRIVFPALATFTFGDHLEYLEDIVVQIDAPQLDCFGKKYTGKRKTSIYIFKSPIYARSSIDQKNYPGLGAHP